MLYEVITERVIVSVPSGPALRRLEDAVECLDPGIVVALV